MKLLFIGSKNMGHLALKELLRQDAQIVAVVACWDDPNPDAWFPSVAELAEHHGLPVFKPQNINDPAFVAEAARLKPDMMLTAFYPRIYRRPLLEIAPQGSINLHFAPLPRYRGSFPGAWAIINGERHHGVTLHYMSPGVDDGDIIDQEFVDIAADDTGRSLYEKCETAGLMLLRRSWPRLLGGDVPRTPQDADEALYHDRTFPYGGVINFCWPARQVHDYVRAMTFPPFDNPFTFFQRRKLTVKRTSVFEASSSAASPGEVVDVNGSIQVQTSDGVVALAEVEDSRGRNVAIDRVTADYGIERGVVLGS